MTSEVMYETGFPVEGFPMQYRWQAGLWHDLFERQIALLEYDIARAKAADDVMVFLSTPLSGRVGSHFSTNVEIADHVARRLMEDWGHRFWVLNPGRYQMESKEGTGLMNRHAETLSKERGISIDIDQLFADSPPGGGDYMRMWVRIMVEDGIDNTGRRWDAFYFMSPSDVRGFFTEGGSRTWTAGVEEYFARKYAMDEDFRAAFDPPFRDAEGNVLEGDAERAECVQRRNNFFRYYTIRAGVNFSLGSHDEWNIWRLLNERRRASGKYGISDQIAGYFEGRQIAPGATVIPTAPGYEVVE